MTLDGLGDERRVGESQSLERFGVLLKGDIMSVRRLEVQIHKETYRSGDIGTSDSLGSGIQKVESRRLADLSNDFGSNTKCCKKIGVSDLSSV